MGYMMDQENPTPEQKQALSNLDDAIKAVWEAFGKGDHPGVEGQWENTPPDERMIGSWLVLLPISGNSEDQVDLIWPHFPPMPAWQTKGLLMEGLDQMRGDVP